MQQGEGENIQRYPPHSTSWPGSATASRQRPLHGRASDPTQGNQSALPFELVSPHRPFSSILYIPLRMAGRRNGQQQAEGKGHSKTGGNEPAATNPSFCPNVISSSVLFCPVIDPKSAAKSGKQAGQSQKWQRTLRWKEGGKGNQQKRRLPTGCVCPPPS